MPKVVVSLVLGAGDDTNLMADGESLSKAVDEDIKEFDEYFQKELGNDPLIRGESAIIKTYLHYQLVHKKQRGDVLAPG